MRKTAVLLLLMVAGCSGQPSPEAVAKCVLNGQQTYANAADDQRDYLVDTYTATCMTAQGYHRVHDNTWCALDVSNQPTNDGPRSAYCWRKNRLGSQGTG